MLKRTLSPDVFIKGHSGVQKGQASSASADTGPDPEHSVGGQLKDHRGGDGRHLQEAPHPQQQGEQPGLPDGQERGREPGQGRREDQEADADAAREAKLTH